MDSKTLNQALFVTHQHVCLQSRLDDGHTAGQPQVGQAVGRHRITQLAAQLARLQRIDNTCALKGDLSISEMLHAGPVAVRQVRHTARIACMRVFPASQQRADMQTT